MSNSLDPASASGSATGNPRNKTALKPGHSLVGWIRLTKSGEDMTGLKGKIIPVSHAELAKHNKTDDCWMAVRGKVYNVTRYLDFHPGGVEQLMRGAGKDATSLFDEFHAWVNIESLLGKCFVGPLRNTVTLDLRDPGSQLDLKLSPPGTSSFIKLPSILSISSETLNKSSEPPVPVPPQPVEIIPRFDWIQKTSEISIFFYTKSFCNPGLSVEKICDKESEIKIFIANMTYSYRFSFLKPLAWPCTVKIHQETGKIEIKYEKLTSELWTNFGIFDRKRAKDETFYTEYSIVSKTFFNNDSFELILRPKKELLTVIPVGYHLNFRVTILGKIVIRSYTPIPVKYASKEAIQTSTELLFLIKTYNFGTLSKYLSQKTAEESVFVSQPKGDLDLSRIKNQTKVAILAAGSGITPMFTLIDHLLERKLDAINLYFFNKTESDIWLHDTLDSKQAENKSLNVKHILSEENSAKYPKSRITKEMIDEVAGDSSFIFICGPIVFNEFIIKALEEHPSGVETHCFQG